MDGSSVSGASDIRHSPDRSRAAGTPRRSTPRKPCSNAIDLPQDRSPSQAEVPERFGRIPRPLQQCNALVQSDTRDEAVRGASNRDAAFAQGASDLGAVYEGRFAHRQQRERLEPCAGSLQCGVSLRIPCSTSVGTIPHSARSWYDRTRDSRRRVCEASRPAKKSIQTLVSTRVIPFPFRALRPAFRPKRSNPSGPSVCAGSCAGADHAARNR